MVIKLHPPAKVSDYKLNEFIKLIQINLKKLKKNIYNFNILYVKIKKTIYINID